MSLLNFRKKKVSEKKTPDCARSCSGDRIETTPCNCCQQTWNAISSLKVLGAGCAACHQQYEYAREAVQDLGLTAEVEYITDMAKVMEYGAMSMPALVVNERVVSMGRVLKPAEIKKILKG